MPDPVDKFIKCKGGQAMRNPNPLDNYTDHSSSLALTEYIMCPIIAVVVIGLIVAACTYFKLL